MSVFVKRKELSKILGISEYAITNMMGMGMPYYEFNLYGGRYHFKVDEVIDWLSKSEFARGQKITNKR